MTNRMNVTEKELLPGFRRSEMSSVKGKNTVTTVTFNPQTIDPGGTLVVEIHKLEEGLCIVPGSILITFEFVNSNKKSWFITTIGGVRTREFTVRYPGGSVMVTASPGTLFSNFTTANRFDGFYMAFYCCFGECIRCNFEPPGPDEFKDYVMTDDSESYCCYDIRF